MSTYKCVDLRYFLNNKGTTNDWEFDLGCLTLARSSLPANAFQYDRQVYFNEVPFQFYKAGMYDNLTMEGQEITFPAARVKEVHLLGGSSDGEFFDTIWFYHDTKEKAKELVGLSNFVSPKAKFGERFAFSVDYIHTIKGKNYDFKPTIWHNLIRFEEPMEMNKIIFEDNPFMHVFAITLGMDR